MSSETQASHGPDAREDEIAAEIAELERRLQQAKARLSLPPSPPTPLSPPSPHVSPLPPASTPHLPSTTYFLLLLSDSALPLGSFAFSSGLESFLAHARSPALTFSSAGGPSSFLSSSSSLSSPSPSPSSAAAAAFLTTFLPLSVSAYASSALPFVLAAHRDPALLPALDDALDAAVVCAVGRRASVAQGRALLGVWEKAFCSGEERREISLAAARHIARFSALLKTTSSSGSSNCGSISNSKKNSKNDDDDDDSGLPPPASAHLAPLFGAVSRALGLGADQAAYVFLLGHARAVASAAVRAGVMGPYQAQRLLAGADLRGLLAAAVAREWRTPVEDAGQTVPVMDLWAGRHELLYSRIFNS